MYIALLKKVFVFCVLFSVLFFSYSCKSCKNKKAQKAELKKAAAECKTKCDLTPDPGTCKAYLPRYYFDKKENKCKEFIWGGCEGVVPFNTLEECEACDCVKALK